MSEFARKPQPLGRQAGLSLIELMVAITISLFLLVGLVSVFATSNQTYMDLGRASQQIENGRFAMQILVDDVSHAGFYGRYSQAGALPGLLPDPCVNSDMTLLRSALPLPVQGYNDPGTSPITACLPAANHLGGTDILVMRRADSTMAAGELGTIPAAALTANGIYMQSNADPSQPPVIGVATGAGGTLPLNGEAGIFTLRNKDVSFIAPIRKYHVHIYFIAPCSVPAGGGSVCTGAAGEDSIPTLKRIELAANGTMNVVSLVEGIENLQIDYGIDNDKDGVPDGVYVMDPGSVANWNDVMSLRINVLSRQIEPTNGYVDAKSYDMGLAGTLAPGGPYKRHVYNAVIRLVNPASRREP
jgi:type IV pilus assembly protein PilW